jgi:hypothetical protein
MEGLVLVLALAVGVWAYGVGLEFRRRALWSYAAFGGLAVLLILLGRLVGSR